MKSILRALFMFTLPVSGVVLMVSGCRKAFDPKTSAQKPAQPAPLVTVTDVPYRHCSVLTVKHDDHLWVTFMTDGRGTTLAHHPDCPCKKP